MTQFNFYSVVLSIVIFHILYRLGESAFDVELIKIQSVINPKDDPIFSFEGLRVLKINRTHYGLTGNLFTKTSIDDNYKVTVTAKHSARGNNQYVMSPFKIGPITTCEFMNSAYKQYLIEGLVGISDLPTEEPLCPLEKKKYFINNFLFDETKLPDALHDGLWCFGVYIHNSDDEVTIISGIEAYFKITKQLHQL